MLWLEDFTSSPAPNAGVPVFGFVSSGPSWEHPTWAGGGLGRGHFILVGLRIPFIPAKAGIQWCQNILGPRFRGDERFSGYPGHTLPDRRAAKPAPLAGLTLSGGGNKT